MTEIERAVREFIATNFVTAKAREDLGADESLMDAGVLDSTGVLELIGFLETHFNISVNDTDLTPDNLGTVSSIVTYVARKTGAT